MHAIGTAVGDGDRDIDHLLDLGIERAGPHGRLQARPCPREKRRIMRERPPKIVDEVALSRGPDIVEDSSGLRGKLFVREQLNGSHGRSHRWRSVRSL